MPYRLTSFVNNNYYHVFNRGVEKRQTFLTDRDYRRFIQTLYYYQFAGPKPRFSTYTRFRNKRFDINPQIIELISYCLMPNHFHFLLRQVRDNGIHEFMRKIGNSYTKYFNTKHNRVGPLFQGVFKAISVENDDQLIHLSRYIHINPYVSDITSDWENYPYSSFAEFIGKPLVCNPKPVLGLFKDQGDYRNFILDHQGYAYEIAKIKHLVLEDV